MRMKKVEIQPSKTFHQKFSEKKDKKFAESKCDLRALTESDRHPDLEIFFAKCNLNVTFLIARVIRLYVSPIVVFCPQDPEVLGTH